jgi:transcriptional regulator with PAS, ATPase and Fis domain
MKEVLALIEKASNCDIKVLINGETGTGKELVSRTIHNNSIRRDNPFVPIDCSMLPETLAESELFGYEKGSFTGAAERKIGRFEMANTGTLFLDEIANLSSTIQIKLLRFLEDKNISRLGSKKNVELDVRIISASNINLSLGVKDKKFREDLYYRLNVFSIDLPPLRDRGEDVIQLANYFLKKFSNEQHKNITGISNESITALKNYNWPGNVRELRNIMERAVLLANNVILPENLGINKSGAEKEEFSELFSNDADDLTLHEISKKASGIAEKRLILKILEKAEYNKTKAAEILKVDYKTLYNKMKEYNIS